MSPWAIRDVAHGKTFHFGSFEEMVAWVLRAIDSKPVLVQADSTSLK